MASACGKRIQFCTIGGGVGSSVHKAYTDRILPGGELVYLAPNGRFHRRGCRYFVPPGAGAELIDGLFNATFLESYCKLCFPNGLPASIEMNPMTTVTSFTIEGAAETNPEGAQTPVLPSLPAPLAPVATANPLFPTPLSTQLPESARRRKKKRSSRGPGLRITGREVFVFTTVVVMAIGSFLALAWLFNWFG